MSDESEHEGVLTLLWEEAARRTARGCPDPTTLLHAANAGTTHLPAEAASHLLQDACGDCEDDLVRLWARRSPSRRLLRAAAAWPATSTLGRAARRHVATCDLPACRDARATILAPGRQGETAVAAERFSDRVDAVVRAIGAVLVGFLHPSLVQGIQDEEATAATAAEQAPPSVVEFGPAVRVSAQAAGVRLAINAARLPEEHRDADIVALLFLEPDPEPIAQVTLPGPGRRRTAELPVAAEVVRDPRLRVVVARVA